VLHLDGFDLLRFPDALLAAASTARSAGVPVSVGPDALDNGLALCMLHHELFDRGILGLDDDLSVVVSRRFSARTPSGRAVYDLHGHPLAARPGTPLPAMPHVRWHQSQVFLGDPLAA
jgi:putative restriction endonuclease